MLEYTGQKMYFDVTIPEDKYETWKDLWVALDRISKKFWFQKEKGEKTDYTHWQCKLVLQSKKTYHAMITEIIPTIGGHWSLTSEANKDNSRYVVKNETRIEGPYSHETELPVEIPLTQDIKNFMEKGLMPWHEFALQYSKSYDERNILAIWNPDGNCVKTRFLKYLCYIGLATMIPATCDTANQIMQFACGKESRKCYSIK